MRQFAPLVFIASAGLALVTRAASPLATGAGETREIGTPAPTVEQRAGLTLEGANQVLAAALAHAREKHAGGAIAVVDEGGSLMAFQRIDGTFAAGATVSIGKARTAAMFKKPTKAFEDSIKDGRTALVAVTEMVPLQGGVPIIVDGQVVGAVGVSGAHSQQEDEEIALAGAGVITGTK